MLIEPTTTSLPVVDDCDGSGRGFVGKNHLKSDVDCERHLNRPGPRGVGSIEIAKVWPQMLGNMLGHDS